MAFATTPQADPAVEKQAPPFSFLVAKSHTSHPGENRIMPFCSAEIDGVHCLVSADQKKLVALLVLRVAFEKTH